MLSWTLTWHLNVAKIANSYRLSLHCGAESRFMCEQPYFVGVLLVATNKYVICIFFMHQSLCSVPNVPSILHQWLLAKFSHF